MPLDALFELGFPTARPHGLASRHSVTRRPIMQKVRGRAFPCGHSSSTACRHAVSGTISLPSPGYFSPFPHGTCSLSVVEEYSALEDGPPGFPLGSTCPAVLGCHSGGVSLSLTGLSPSMAGLSSAVRLAKRFVTPSRNWGPGRVIPRLPASNAPRLALTRFRLFPVRSPLLGESQLISVPRGT